MHAHSRRRRRSSDARRRSALKALCACIARHFRCLFRRLGVSLALSAAQQTEKNNSRAVARLRGAQYVRLHPARRTPCLIRVLRPPPARHYDHAPGARTSSSASTHCCCRRSRWARYTQRPRSKRRAAARYGLAALALYVAGTSIVSREARGSSALSYCKMAVTFCKYLRGSTPTTGGDRRSAGRSTTFCSTSRAARSTPSSSLTARIKATGRLGGVVKFGLGVTSMVFDVILLVQHCVLTGRPPCRRRLGGVDGTGRERRRHCWAMLPFAEGPNEREWRTGPATTWARRGSMVRWRFLAGSGVDADAGEAWGARLDAAPTDNMVGRAWGSRRRRAGRASPNTT